MTFIPLEFAGGDGAVEAIDGPQTITSLHHRRSPLAEPAEQRAVLNRAALNVGPSGTGDFGADLASAGWSALRPETVEIFQINLGKLCNMTCRHCHVDAGPDRTDENMNLETVEACLRAIEISGAHTVDLTGGEPVLNPHFEYLVDTSINLGKHVIVRCNLTILTTRRFGHLPEWFAERGIEVVCSLPHYRKLSTDAQRGDGTYAKSIDALRMLNRSGYGSGDAKRVLTIVTNPVGAFLAGNQSSLEKEWKTVLSKNHGIHFDRLLTLNNMPISRYLEWLLDKEMIEAYMDRLVNAFNPATISGLMCRNTLSVGWDGRLYDCDFNQQLEMEADLPDERRPHVADFDPASWKAHDILTDRHCYGCTAGSGSSCGGAIA